MADRGILFSAPMVRALLAGPKTQTRRLISKPEYYGCPTGDCPHERQVECNAAMQALAGEIVPHAVGDRLYVREAWAKDDLMPNAVRYVATDDIHELRRKRPSIHMPRWASRLWLTVTDVRVQPLQDISEADAIAEGIEPIDHQGQRGWKSYETYSDGTPHPHASVPNKSPVTSYRELWDSLHRDAGTRWADNPWIYALTFTVHEGNIDA